MKKVEFRNDKQKVCEKQKVQIVEGSVTGREHEERMRKRAREEAEKFHRCCDNVGGRQRVGRNMGEKNTEGTGSWLCLSLTRIRSSAEMQKKHEAARTNQW